jgi:hypothetical protein
MATPRFIQLGVPSPPLKPMDQSRRGVVRMRLHLPMTYDRDSEIMQHATLSNHLKWGTIPTTNNVSGI